MQNLHEGSWLLDENNDVSIDNSHILVLLHPFDRTADVTENNRNKIMHLKCKKIAPRRCKIIIKNSAPEWPRLTATAIHSTLEGYSHGTPSADSKQTKFAGNVHYVSR